LNHKTVVGY